MSPIFLSYARIDNDKDEHDPNQGWIEYFHTRLRLALIPKLGERLDFWRDVQKIEKGEIWHEPIKEALRDAKVLLSVLSPSFLKSDNCKFELNYYLDCHKDDDSRALKERVIKVVKHITDLSVLPPELRETEAFEFFIKDPKDSKNDLSYYTPTAGLRQDKKQAFMDQLECLANRLAALLKDIQAVTEPPRATVFLAVPYPGSTLGELYHRIKAELERRNIKVLPDHKRFFAEFNEPDPILLDQAVTNARLAIHLLDPTAGKEAMALDQRQIEATTTRARDATRLQRLIWLWKESEGVDDNALIAELRRSEANGGRLIKDDNLVEESSERFIELMLRMLLPNDATPGPVAAPIYMLVHPDDAVACKRDLPMLRSRGQSCRQPLPKSLKPTDRVAIYWGVKDADWVFGEIDRLKGEGVSGIVLVKGSPASAEKAEFLADEVAEVIDLAAAPAPGETV